ncbi:hypothetical protein G7K_1418-t1 [Saitoella complicata NRRL Y-17804]|uniref:Uncharacterized protein n=2 Tax=Saitoella complicata (strain BCRC 22490 / CBS 7301 / JCM 7358 / NBRC 10748 / NRRL Y-17804) TaxID=698492 RepID=A0A0E9NBM5_SAICN|nr:hypothetical protein G7K_1418-t1 [Saitoella complicata NRRL Y-17804]
MKRMADCGRQNAKNGASCPNRTSDLRITSATQYHCAKEAAPPYAFDAWNLKSSWPSTRLTARVFNRYLGLSWPLPRLVNPSGPGIDRSTVVRNRPPDHSMVLLTGCLGFPGYASSSMKQGSEGLCRRGGLPCSAYHNGPWPVGEPIIVEWMSFAENRSGMDLGLTYGPQRMLVVLQTRSPFDPFVIRSRGVTDLHVKYDPIGLGSLERLDQLVFHTRTVASIESVTWLNKVLSWRRNRDWCSRLECTPLFIPIPAVGNLDWVLNDVRLGLSWCVSYTRINQKARIRPEDSANASKNSSDEVVPHVYVVGAGTLVLRQQKNLDPIASAADLTVRRWDYYWYRFKCSDRDSSLPQCLAEVRSEAATWPRSSDRPVHKACLLLCLFSAAVTLTPPNRRSQSWPFTISGQSACTWGYKFFRQNNQVQDSTVRDEPGVPIHLPVGAAIFGTALPRLIKSSTVAACLILIDPTSSSFPLPSINEKTTQCPIAAHQVPMVAKFLSTLLVALALSKAVPVKASPFGLWARDGYGSSSSEECTECEMKTASSTECTECEMKTASTTEECTECEMKTSSCVPQTETVTTTCYATESTAYTIWQSVIIPETVTTTCYSTETETLPAKSYTEEITETTTCTYTTTEIVPTTSISTCTYTTTEYSQLPAKTSIEEEFITVTTTCYSTETSSYPVTSISTCTYTTTEYSQLPAKTSIEEEFITVTTTCYSTETQMFPVTSVSTCYVTSTEYQEVTYISTCYVTETALYPVTSISTCTYTTTEMVPVTSISTCTFTETTTESCTPTTTECTECEMKTSSTECTECEMKTSSTECTECEMKTSSTECTECEAKTSSTECTECEAKTATSTCEECESATGY